MATKPLPRALKDIKNLAEMMYQRMVAREEEAVEKIRQVIQFATTDDCGYLRWFRAQETVLTDA